MSSRGVISRLPNRRFKIILALQGFWLLMVLFLGIWWGKLLTKQGEKIVELETRLGLPADSTQDYWNKTQNMIFWESTAFLVVLLSLSVAMIWLYWRDSKRSRSLQAFFASVTHELKTPLTSIRLQAEALSQEAEEGSEGAKLVQRLLEDAERLQSQVDRTLELSRLEGGGPLYTQSLPIKSWIDRILKNLEDLGLKQFEIDDQMKNLTVKADPNALMVILKNLIENSKRHSKAEQLKILLQTDSDSTHVTLTYRDNGQGYPEDTKPLGKIFEKGPESQGAGVGLYLVRLLMRKMGGDAKFKNAEPPHSGFEVELKFRAGDQHVE